MTCSHGCATCSEPPRARPHEVLVDLIRTAPELIETLVDAAIGASEGAARAGPLGVEDAALGDLQPTERRADLVPSCREPRTRAPALAVITEVQLRPDRDKRLALPTYVANAHAR